MLINTNSVLYIALQVQARNSGSTWDQEVPEIHRVAHQEAALSEAGPWDCSGLQDWPEIPVQRCACSSGGSWGLPSWSVWGHQLGSHSCQESDNHAQGHSARSSHQRREGLSLYTPNTQHLVILITTVFESFCQTVPMWRITTNKIIEMYLVYYKL